MRARVLTGCLAGCLAAALLAAGGPSASAQDDGRWPLFQQRQPVAPPAPRPRTEPAPRGAQQQAASRQAPAPPPPQPSFFEKLFGVRPAPPPPAPPPVEARRPADPGDFQGARPLPERGFREGGVDRRRVVARPAPVARAPKVVVEKPKAVEPTTHVVVFGDSLAELLGDGLAEAYEDAVEIAVVDRTKPDSGLIRSDHYDWAKAIGEYLGGNNKITLAVMMLGANDRQPVREGDISHEPLSDRWREIYRDRVDAVTKLFAERRIPLVWVGAPPVKNERGSADLIAVNELVRERVQRAGGTYVDIWPGFVDDENRYASVGPDTGGQTARLRTNDGVHFTKAGGRKAAFFVETELKRLLGRKDGTSVAALPGEGGLQGIGPQPGASPVGTDAVDRMIAASLPALPEPSGLLPLAARPAAGPVVPLTKPDVSPGGALMGARPRFDGDAAFAVDQALRNGVAPAPKPGRADDFSWPRS